MPWSGGFVSRRDGKGTTVYYALAVRGMPSYDKVYRLSPAINQRVLVGYIGVVYGGEAGLISDSIKLTKGRQYSLCCSTTGSSNALLSNPLLVPMSELRIT